MTEVGEHRGNFEHESEGQTGVAAEEVQISVPLCQPYGLHDFWR